MFCSNILAPLSPVWWLHGTFASNSCYLSLFFGGFFLRLWNIYTCTWSHHSTTDSCWFWKLSSQPQIRTILRGTNIPEIPRHPLAGFGLWSSPLNCPTSAMLLSVPHGTVPSQITCTWSLNLRVWFWQSNLFEF